MPKDIQSTPLFYEWFKFNNAMFSEWHKEIAEQLKGIAPDIMLHSKTMSIFGTADNEYHRKFLQYGTDIEEFAAFSDISGNDAWCFYGKYHLPLSIKLQWYDFLAGINHVPIFNSEDHVIEDWDTSYCPEQLPHVLSDMWQGAIHGRSAATLWVWERSVLQEYASGSIMERPDIVAGIGQVCLDLNRLAYQVKALQDIQPTIGVLYSDSSRVYSPHSANALFNAYEAALFSGKKAVVLTESLLVARKYANLDLIIIPEVTHITAAALDSLRKHNVSIIIIGEHSLKKDEHNHLHNSGAVNEIYNNATLLESSANELYMDSPVKEDIHKTIAKTLGDSEIKIINSDGNPEYGVEWLTVPFDNGFIINICNHQWGESKKVKIIFNGKEAYTMKELISDTVLSELLLEPLVPKLIYLEKNSNTKEL